MGDDVDFEAYAGARWHQVVHTLALLGVPPGHAATLAREALVGIRSEWSHQDEFDDLDAELYREVLDLRRHDRASWWNEPPLDDELWVELEAELDRLTAAQREWLVLRSIAELPEPYVAAVVGEPTPRVPAGVPNGERLREVARAVPVPPPDLEQVADLAAAHARRHRRRLQAGVAGFVVAAAGISLLIGIIGDPRGEELDPLPVTRGTTGSAIPWYADGELHLRQAVLDLPGLRDLAAIRNGAVYTDGDGDLLFVSDQGERSRLATIGDEGTFVASDEDGLVAWLPEGDGEVLVVHDLSDRTDVVRFEVEGVGEVLAIDNRDVFLRDERGDLEVSLGTGDAEPLGTASLLDVSATARAFQEAPGTLRLVQPLFRKDFTRPGQGAQLSEDGNFVLTRVGEEVAIYDTRSGDRLTGDIEPESLVLAAEFGQDPTVTYLVLDPRASSGMVVVRTCSLILVIPSTGVREPRCRQEVAGIYRGVDTDLRLAR